MVSDATWWQPCAERFGARFRSTHAGLRGSGIGATVRGAGRDAGRGGPFAWRSAGSGSGCVGYVPCRLVFVAAAVPFDWSLGGAAAAAFEIALWHLVVGQKAARRINTAWSE